MVEPKEVKALVFFKEEQQQSDLRCLGVLRGREHYCLRKCSLPLLSAAELSGKAHEVFGLTITIIAMQEVVP